MQSSAAARVVASDTDTLHDEKSATASILSRLEGCLFRCLVDDDYTIVYISEAIQRLVGYPAADFIGHRVRSFTSLIQPDDMTGIVDTISKAMDARQAWDIDYRIHNAKGIQIWVRESATAVRDAQGKVLYIEGVLLDIDARKRRELKTLAASEDMTRFSSEILQRTNGILATLGKLHLLGLNARIEAARVGSVGAGFGVVAQEINVLSNETMANAKLIVELTGKLGALSAK